MRVLASLSTVAIAAIALAACGLEMGGLADVGSSDGGPALDGAMTAEGGSSSGGSSGSSSGGDDGSTGAVDGSSEGSSSGAMDSTAPPDAPVADTGSGVDSSIPETGVPETGTVETGTTCTTANGCYVIPGGWALVPFAPGVSAQPPACPAGYTNAQPTSLVEGPSSASACACGMCTSGATPTCGGALSDFYDVRIGGTGNCGMAGMPATNANNPPGACGTDLYNGGGGIGSLSYKNLDIKYVPANTLTGGQCTSKGTPGTVTFASQDRSCTPDNGQSGGCTGNQCTPGFTSPFKVCVVKNGAQACPGAPFTDQHSVGTGVNPYTCSDCGCNVTGTCNGGTMKLYTDDKCSKGELDVQADGTCVNPNAPSDSYASYKYVANAPTNVGCQSTGTSGPQAPLQLANPETICCVP